MDQFGRWMFTNVGKIAQVGHLVTMCLGRPSAVREQRLTIPHLKALIMAFL